MPELSGASILLLIICGLFIIQAVGGYLQIRDYQRAVRRLHKLGNVVEILCHLTAVKDFSVHIGHIPVFVRLCKECA